MVSVIPTEDDLVIRWKHVLVLDSKIVVIQVSLKEYELFVIFSNTGFHDEPSQTKFTFFRARFELDTLIMVKNLSKAFLSK